MRPNIRSSFYPTLLSGWPVHENGASSAINILPVPEPNSVITPPGEDPPPPDLDFSPVVTTDNQIYAFDDEARTRFTRYTSSDSSMSLSGDIDADGITEIVVAEENNDKISVYDAFGAMIDNFPVNIGDDINCEPALTDLNGDGRLDIVLASEDRLYAVDYNGNVLTGWNGVNPGIDYISGIAAGDIDGDCLPEIAVTGEPTYPTEGSMLTVIDSNGTPLWNNPVSGETGGAFVNGVSPPVLCNLDGGLDLEIIYSAYYNPPGGKEFKEEGDPKDYLFCYKNVPTGPINSDGSSHQLWTVEANDEAFAGTTTRPIIGTYPGIGKFLSIKNADSGSAIFKITSTEANWLNNGGYGTTLGDIDGDGKVEVLRPPLFAYEINTGDAVEGWNGSLPGDSYAIPAVCDLNEDGMADVVAGDSEAVYAFTTNTPYDDSHLSMDWPRTLHDNLNTNNYEIFAPTNVVVEDVEEDHGHKLHISWMPSLDDGGGRSSRVAGYELYRLDVGLPSSGIDADTGKTARDIELSSSSVNDSTPDAGNGIGLMDSDWELVADDILPGEYEYTDTDGIDPLDSYMYYLVAFENPAAGIPGGNKRYSTHSMKDSATAHDNIAPRPPTDVEYVWGVQRPWGKKATITWTLSIDDPNYEASKTIMEDSTSRLFYEQGEESKRELADRNIISVPPGNSSSPVDLKASEGAVKGIGDGRSGNAGNLLAGSDEAKRKLAEAGNNDISTIGSKNNDKFTNKDIPVNKIGTPDVALNDSGDGSNKDKDGPGKEHSIGDVESYIVIKEVDMGFGVVVTTLGEPAAGIDLFTCWIPVSEIEDTTFKVAAKDSENISEYVEAVELTFGLTTKEDNRSNDILAADSSGEGMSGVVPRTFGEPIAFPNPTTGAVTFGWPVKSEHSNFEVSVYDISGRKVWTSRVGQTNHANWNGNDDGGRSISEGVYIVTIEADSEKYTLKLVKE